MTKIDLYKKTQFKFMGAYHNVLQKELLGCKTLTDIYAVIRNFRLFLQDTEKNLLSWEVEDILSDVLMNMVFKDNNEESFKLNLKYIIPHEEELFREDINNLKSVGPS